MDQQGYLDIISEMTGKKVVVVGDLVADEFIIGHTSRISREAPVLILNFHNRALMPGGGANTVNNIASLGGKPTAIGMVGGDIGGELMEMLSAGGADISGVVKQPGWETIVKTRIMAGGENTTLQQVIRIDRGEPARQSADTSRNLLENLKRALVGADAMLISDYDGGVISPEMVEFLNGVAYKNEVIVTVDSHHRLKQLKGCFSYTPNEEEAVELLGAGVDELGVKNSGEKLLEMTDGKSVLLTRGRFGMALFMPGADPVVMPVFGSDEISDVTGAGDTVIASFTLALAAGADPADAAFISNIAAGIVVAKRGTATVSPEELSEGVKRYFGTC